MKRLLILISLLVYSTLWATEVVWLKLDTRFTYKDLFTACSTTHSVPVFYLGTEIEQGRVRRAVLRDSMSTVLSNQITLTSEEAEKIIVARDKKERFWLSDFSLSARLLLWTFARAGVPLEYCIPSKPSKTVEPGTFVFKFDLSAMDTGQYHSSRLGRFSGKRIDGAAYNATLQFTQSQLKP